MNLLSLENQLINGDCIEVMRGIPAKSINLIVIDPPYNIKKADWDKWKSVESYVDWMGEVFKQCQRILKDNGSFYFFHNDFMQIVELQNWLNKNSKFVFKQLIIWNKKFKGAKNEGFLQGFNEVDGLRNYQKMAEYCLYYTFQDETGLTTVMLDTNNFPTMRKYFKDLQECIGLNKKGILEIIGGRADHCFRWGSSQWDIPTQETYQMIIDYFNINKWTGFKDYESLRKEYESLRKEYESLRYIFNNLKSHHSVWDYEIAAKSGHITPKPVPLIENIILHSSNENDIVLDCFGGSMTTAIAAINTGRRYICIERGEKEFKNGSERVDNYLAKITKGVA
jgi:site-specific DNA-methyltransferase (adenine-specific)